MSNVLKQHASGLGPMSETMVVDEGKTYQLVSVTLNVSVAPTTSEDFTLTKRAFAGDVYDVPLYILDLSIIGVTAIVWQPDQPMYLVGGDELRATWLNTDDRLWGLEFTVLRVHP
jgi:hypothetical protein